MLNTNFDLDLCTTLVDYEDYRDTKNKYELARLNFIKKNEGKIKQTYLAYQRETKEKLERKIQQRKNSETRQRQNGIPFLVRKEYREKQITLESNFKKKLEKKMSPVSTWLIYQDMQFIKRYGLKRFIHLFYEII